MKPILRNTLTVVLVLSAILFSCHCLKSGIFMVRNISHYWMFLSGGAIYFILAKTYFKEKLMFYQTWTHEHLHLFMCIVFHHEIRELHVSSKHGGMVEHVGNQNIFITLAPYFFPLFTFLLLLAWLIIPLRYTWFQILIGASFFFHAHEFFSDITSRPTQPDILKFGCPMSFAFIFTFLPMNFAICIYAIDMKLWHAITFLFADVWNTVASVFSLIF